MEKIINLVFAVLTRLSFKTVDEDIINGRITFRLKPVWFSPVFWLFITALGLVAVVFRGISIIPELIKNVKKEFKNGGHFASFNIVGLTKYQLFIRKWNK